MTDEVEATVASSAIERAMEIYETLKARDHAELVQACKALTKHILGQVAAGQTDEQKLVVSALAHLKSLEGTNFGSTEIRSDSESGSVEDGSTAASKTP